MDDLFRKNQRILITGTRASGTAADIFIDETGAIAGIGPDIRAGHKNEADLVIDGSGTIALPGLVNTHTHAAMTLLRGYADDMILQDWLSQKIWPLEAHLTPSDVYWGTKLACLEMIKTGTTAFNDMYFMMEEAARAVDEAGIRATLCYGFIDLFSPEKREAESRATEKLAGHLRALGNPRIQAAVGPHSPYTVSPEGMRWCAGFAAEQKIGVHIHLSETEKEVSDTLARDGKRPAALLDECGLLTPRTVAAHGCWIDEAECALLGRRGVSVSYNPASNMKLATGRALPYRCLTAAGANVCLGTDGCASNNNLDLFEEMKIAALLQKFFWNDPTLLPAREVLELSSAHGAKALGLPTGRLTAGSPADLILVRMDTPCNTPLHNAISNLVYSCSGACVDTTICNGRILMHDREVPGEEEILAGAAQAAHDLVLRALPG
jgi:5-methylthioadenosine/S-adenosylhomocysteine deaminase